MRKTAASLPLNLLSLRDIPLSGGMRRLLRNRRRLRCIDVLRHLADAPARRLMAPTRPSAALKAEMLSLKTGCFKDGVVLLLSMSLIMGYFKDGRMAITCIAGQAYVPFRQPGSFILLSVAYFLILCFICIICSCLFNIKPLLYKTIRYEKVFSFYLRGSSGSSPAIM